MKQVELREGGRRQHRVVALYAVLQCWTRRLDGLVISRTQFERMLGLDRFKEARMEWMKEDFREYFEHVNLYKIASKKNSLHSLYVSNLDMDESLPHGAMPDEVRLKRIPEGGPKLGMFEIWPRPESGDIPIKLAAASPLFSESGNYDERILLANFALLVSGQASLKQLFPPPATPPKKGGNFSVPIPRSQSSPQRVK